MKFGYTIIYVEDVKETVEFYKAAFGFELKFITPEHDYGELVSGETTIAFASIELGKSNFKGGFLHTSGAGKPFGVEMAFVTANIEADFKKAIEWANKAIAIDPNYAPAYLNRGIAKEVLRDLDGACEDWHKAEELGSTEGKTYYSANCSN